MSRSGAGNKKLPECKFFHELSFLNSVGKSQESHSNFIDFNKTSVTETFQETAPSLRVILEIRILKLHQNQKESKMINQPTKHFF